MEPTYHPNGASLVSRPVGHWEVDLADPVVEHLRVWWRDVLPNLNVSAQVRWVPIGSTGKSRVWVNHVTRAFSLQGRRRYLVATEWRPLVEPQSHGVDIARIEEADGRERGRALWCYDFVREEVMAAVSFHVDWPKVPPLIEAFALRQEDELRTESVRCAILLKAYVHAIGERVHGRTEADFDAENTAWEKFAKTYLGFAGPPRRDDAASPRRGQSAPRQSAASVRGPGDF